MVSRPFMQQRSDLVWNHYGSLWLPMVAYWLLMVAWGLLGDFLVMYAYHMRKLYIFHKLYSSSSRMIRLYFHSKFDVYPAAQQLQTIACISHHASSVGISVEPPGKTQPLRRGHAEVIQCLCEAEEAGGRIMKMVVKLRYGPKILDK